MTTELPAVPEADELAHPEVVVAMELEVRENVRDITDFAVLETGASNMNKLAKALAGTRLAPYPVAAARRIEWQIGRLLGPPPGRGPGRGRNLAPEQGFLADTDRAKFRLIGTLNLEWEKLEPWAQSRTKLVKAAREQMREPSEEYDLRPGDFREVLADLDAESVSLMLTDPPYEAKKYEKEYTDLGAFAAEKLEPGGSLVCYVGQTTLPHAITALAANLRYFWCLALVHRGGIQQMRMGVRCGWKPVLWFTKGPRRGRENVYDILAGSSPRKVLHDWAQGVEETLPLIESLTNPEELVCDPFAGSGSFGVAACKIGRRFVGATL